MFSFLGGGGGGGADGGMGEYIYTGAGAETDNVNDEEEEGEEYDDEEEEDVFYAAVPPPSVVELPPLHTHTQRHTLSTQEASDSKGNGASLITGCRAVSVEDGKDKKTEGGKGHLLDLEKEKEKKESSKPIINEDDFIPHECVICMDEFTLENPEMHTRKYI